MSARTEAIRSSISRSPREIRRPKDSLSRDLPVSEFFGQSTYGLSQLKEKLTNSVVRLQTSDDLLRETFWNYYNTS